ncbi:hypothetical protein TKK_0010227 [Trichogramma kaykai]
MQVLKVLDLIEQDEEALNVYQTTMNRMIDCLFILFANQFLIQLPKFLPMNMKILQHYGPRKPGNPLLSRNADLIIVEVPPNHNHDSRTVPGVLYGLQIQPVLQLRANITEIVYSLSSQNLDQIAQIPHNLDEDSIATLLEEIIQVTIKFVENRAKIVSALICVILVLMFTYIFSIQFTDPNSTPNSSQHPANNSDISYQPGTSQTLSPDPRSAKGDQQHVRSDIIFDVRNDVNRDVSNRDISDIKNDVNYDVNNDIKNDVNNDVNNDIKNDVNNDVNNYVNNDVKILVCISHQQVQPHRF